MIGLDSQEAIVVRRIVSSSQLSFLKNAMARLVRLLVHYNAISFSNNEACAKHNRDVDHDVTTTTLLGEYLDVIIMLFTVAIAIL